MEFISGIQVFYWIAVNVMALAGLVAFILLPKNERKIRVNRLILLALILVCFYENLGFYLSSKKLVNFWVFNVFFFHLATWIHLFIVREFILSPVLRKVINGFAWSLFFFSAIPYALGVFPYNELLSYTALFSSSFMIVSCAFFFFELLSNDTYLPINPLRFSRFWITTALLLFYLGNFILFASLSYIINHYQDIFVRIIGKFPMISASLVYFTFFMYLIKWKIFKDSNLNSIHESG